ncbi:hypothetical protein G6F63_016539 [Rhizopus arrhizus]|nr:hypothetical protein G6F63_016539 [Rhizopus arrhizus]
MDFLDALAHGGDGGRQPVRAGLVQRSQDAAAKRQPDQHGQQQQDAGLVGGAVEGHHLAGAGHHRAAGEVEEGRLGKSRVAAAHAYSPCE